MLAEKVALALGWPRQLQESVSGVQELLPPPAVPEGDGVPQGVVEELSRLGDLAEKSVTDLDREIESSLKRLEDPSEKWASLLEDSQSKIVRALAEIGIEDAQELAHIQDAVAKLKAELNDLPGEKDGKEQLEKERTVQLEELGRIARRKSRIVEGAARTLNDKLSGRVRLVVDPLDDKSHVLSWLRKTMQGESVPRTQLERLAQHPTGSISKAIREGNQAIVDLGCTSATAAKITKRLDNKMLRELEEISTPDLIVAEVNLGSPDAEIWKHVDMVSPGQRATALLSLVLLSSQEPLIIDQPEDDLDNQHIYEDVVQVLTEVCQHRQVIVATHNANIPVLGDAELVVAFDADAERSRLEAIGGFENSDVASHARRILEGGDDAFNARTRRYRPHGVQT